MLLVVLPRLTDDSHIGVIHLVRQDHPLDLGIFSSQLPEARDIVAGISLLALVNAISTIGRFEQRKNVPKIAGNFLDSPR